LKPNWLRSHPRAIGAWARIQANGGKLLRDLRMPDFTEYAVDVSVPGPAGAATPGLGRFCAMWPS